MKISAFQGPAGRPRRIRSGGSVLIIALLITFGLVSLSLYFGHSMLFEFRASDQNAAGLEAEQAIEGAVRYISFVLTNATDLGHMPSNNLYQCEAVPVGDATFWLVGRGDHRQQEDRPVYGLIDEGSKLNLNTATQAMLEALPRMTPELAAAIIDWRDEDNDITQGGAESETYQMLNPPYYCKNSRFDTVEELHLVAGVDWSILYGEDANMNGIQDSSETGGKLSFTTSGLGEPAISGLLDCVTVYTREPNTRSDGSTRINVNDSSTGQDASSTNTLAYRLQDLFGQQRANEIQSRVAAGQGSFRSLVQFYLQSGMSLQEFGQIADDLSVTNASFVEGLVNVNTASAAVLACIPGIGTDNADLLVAQRRSQPDTLTSVAWVTQVLDQASAQQAGPYITTRTYQFSADIVAVGHEGRGYRRTWFVIDTSDGQPKIIYRRDRARLGWALGSEPRKPLLLSGRKELR